MNQALNLNTESIISCFQIIHNPNTDPITRKNADQYLIEAQKNEIQLLPKLMEIIQTNLDNQIKFQALLFFSNVIKRTWTTRRLKQIHSAYEALKKNIRARIVLDLYQAPRQFVFTYFDIVKFIAKIDYPHIFPEFTQLVVKLTEQIKIDQNSVIKFKELKEIFYELASRKGFTSAKFYQQILHPILQKICMASSYFDNQIQKGVEKNHISSQLAKLSKYTDQIIISILRMAPLQLLDSEQFLLIAKQQHSKLDQLLILHQGSNNTVLKSNLQKNIKSLIYDLSTLQQSNPFSLSAFISEYFTSISQIIVNPSNFVKNTTLKYSLLAMRKFIKQFSFYSDNELFMISIGSKMKSKNYLTLRQICHKSHQQVLTPETIEGLLNHLIGNLMCAYCKSQNVSFDIEENMIIDRSQQKQLSIENCSILLIQAILQRYTDQSHNLIKGMIINLFNSNFEGVDPQVLNNIFGVLALLPRTAPKAKLNELNDIPIVEILKFIYENSKFKGKIPTLIAGWFDYFSNDQLLSLVSVLLQFIQNESDTSLILNCCQSLDKIIVTKKYILNGETIKSIFPIAIHTFEKTDYPQVLWPMVNLISNIIIQCEFDSEIILQSLQNSTLSVLITSNSTILIEALSEMFKNILCVIPRNRAAQAIYKLTCHFLNNHLSKLTSVNSEKVLNLWYIVIREYSPIQNCSNQLIQLYQTHYKSNLFYKTPTLVYILEQYMLLGLIEIDINEFSSLIYEFYQQAEEMQKVQNQQLKVAALSFQITLITKYTLKQVNNQQMLRSILKDFYCLDIEQISVPVHNSLLSIINRYIILHRDDFLSFLNSINADLIQFYHVYLDNMKFLTSQSAKKINTIAVLSLIPFLPNDFLISRLHYILMTIIPSVQIYLSTQQSNPYSNLSFTGKIMNSPTHRFASNFLSERKQEIRTKGMFQEVNIVDLFKFEIQNACEKLGTDPNVISQNFPENGWNARFGYLLK